MTYTDSLRNCHPSSFGRLTASLGGFVVPIACLVLALPPAVHSQESTASVDPLDWPHARGPGYDGVSFETGLVDRIDLAKKENVAWERTDLGGRSTPIVMNGKIYLLTRAEPETAREGERVLCLDAVTGKTIWENR